MEAVVGEREEREVEKRETKRKKREGASFEAPRDPVVIRLKRELKIEP